MNLREGSTRDKILKYAMGIIGEQGEEAIRLQDIASETNASISSIYYYFDDREGLVAEAGAARIARELSDYARVRLPQFEAVSNAEEFRDLMLDIFQSAFLPERWQRRMQQVNVIGSTLGRPVLKERIAALESDLVLQIRDRLEIAQERGWMRQDVDVTALTAWFMGTILGRCMIELGETDVIGEEWNRIAEMSIMYAFFGDTG